MKNEMGRLPLLLTALFCVVDLWGSARASQAQILSGVEQDDSDQTRVFGAVYDSSGEPMPRVDVRVFNDRAPANEVRTRTRKTGSFVARGFGALYTDRDGYGLMARVRFERDGYRTAQVVTAVEKNNGRELVVVLWREDEDPESFEGRSVLLRGRVQDARGKKVRNATVEAVAPDGVVLGQTTSDRSGQYELLVWAGPDRYDVRASSAGSTGHAAVAFEDPPRSDLVAQVEVDVTLEP